MRDLRWKGKSEEVWPDRSPVSITASTRHLDIMLWLSWNTAGNVFRKKKEKKCEMGTGRTSLIRLAVRRACVQLANGAIVNSRNLMRAQALN